MYFFFVLIVMLSAILGIIGLGNDADPKLGQEYVDIPPFLRNIYMIMRFSFGDFVFEGVPKLNAFEKNMFWIFWVLIVVLTCLVFLNFIIAEVSMSYQKVVDSVDELVLKEKANLINESEDMLSNKYLNVPYCFPRYLIIREKDI